jgi:hypothetical protein
MAPGASMRVRACVMMTGVGAGVRVRIRVVRVVQVLVAAVRGHGRGLSLGLTGVVMVFAELDVLAWVTGLVGPRTLCVIISH